MASWKTTVCGILGIVVAGINFIAMPMLDADPATLPNYTAFVAALTAGIGLLFARDNNVSSEQAGVK